MANTKAGRPKKITKATLQKLEEGFLKGFSDREACFYAGISTSTLYNYCNEHEEFLERKELLKENTKMKAKANVSEAIGHGDLDISKWYLERKAKDEFSVKQEMKLDGLESEQTKLNDLLKQLRGDG